MKRRHKLPILALGLLAAGGLRASWEVPLTAALRADGLLAKPVALGTREKIGQTSSAVALGGLRTLVATFLNLRAQTDFEQRRWGELADNFELIVDLAPGMTYYWDTGSWHLAYNAASDYRYNSELPALRRREAWRATILRGRDFLQRGIRTNPGNWQLNLALGNLLSDPKKLVDFPAAAAAFKAAADTGQAPPYVRRKEFLALGRSPGREAEALELGRRLYAEPSNRLPALNSLMVALECRADPGRSPKDVAIATFGSAQSAYVPLCDYWVRVREGYPLNGIAAALQGLEETLAIPAEKSIFKRQLPPVEDSW